MPQARHDPQGTNPQPAHGCPQTGIETDQSPGRDAVWLRIQSAKEDDEVAGCLLPGLQKVQPIDLVLDTTAGSGVGKEQWSKARIGNQLQAFINTKRPHERMQQRIRHSRSRARVNAIFREPAQPRARPGAGEDAPNRRDMGDP